MNRDKIIQATNELASIQDLLRFATTSFSHADLVFEHGATNAWDEANLLLLTALGLPLSYPMELMGARLTSSEINHIVDLIEQRIERRVPVPYLTEQAWFCGLPFYVNPNVSIPRSAIEQLIDERFETLLSQSPGRILDLCTGCGAIAIACAYEFDDAEIDAIDLSTKALEICQQNIIDHGLEDQVTPICSDLFKQLPEEQYDLIICTPPHIDQLDMDLLPREYLHEPEIALAAGNDGLDLVHSILAYAGDYLTDDGVLICDLDHSRINLEAIYPEVPFQWVDFDGFSSGIFSLTAEQLREYHTLFLAQIN